MSWLHDLSQSLRSAVGVVANPNGPTLEALRNISHTLHDAGWADPDPAPPPLTEDRLGKLRQAFDTLLRPDHLDIIRETLRERHPLPVAAEHLGLGPAEAERLLVEALRRLDQFAEAAAGTLTDS